MLYVPAAFTVSVPLLLSVPFTSQTISSAFKAYSSPYWSMQDAVSFVRSKVSSPSCRMYSVSIGLYGSSASAISAGARAGFTLNTSALDCACVPAAVQLISKAPASVTVSVLPVNASPFTSQIVLSGFSAYLSPY